MVHRAPVRVAICSLLLGSACSVDTEGIAPDEPEGSSSGTIDDGLDVSSDTGPPVDVCGDAEVGPLERCDDGINDGSYGGCAPDCASLGPHCGDGRLDATEQCDGGSDCHPECVLPGGLVWLRSFDVEPGASEAGLAIAATRHDALVVVGHRDVSGRARQGFVRGYDANGEFAWAFPIEAPPGSMAEASGVAIDPSDDGIVAIGRMGDLAEPQRSDLWIARLDATGEPEWIQSFGAVESAVGRSVAIDETGVIYAAGEVDGAAWLRVYDHDGRPGWTESLSGPKAGRVGATSVAIGERVAMAGFVGQDARELDLWFGVYDRDGSRRWSRTLGSPGPITELAHDVAMSPSGNVAVVGVAGVEVPRVWIGVYDPEGEPLWVVEGAEVTRLHLAHEGVRTVAFGPDEAVLVAGAMERAGEVAVHKYDAKGGLGWSTPIPLAGRAVVHGMTLDTRGYVVATGRVESDGVTEGWLAKFAP